jgi:hypothetical protein
MERRMDLEVGQYAVPDRGSGLLRVFLGLAAGSWGGRRVGGLVRAGIDIRPG